MGQIYMTIYLPENYQNGNRFKRCIVEGTASKAGPDIEAIESLHSRSIEQAKVASGINQKDKPAEASIPLDRELDVN